MIEHYEPNAGQTYIPAEESRYGTVSDFMPLKTPEPELPIALTMLPEFRDNPAHGASTRCAEVTMCISNPDNVCSQVAYGTRAKSC